MHKAIIDITLKQRMWVLLIFGVFAIISGYFLLRIPIDAVPDVTPIQVVVNTKTGAIDPERTEKVVSYPIEAEMGGIPNVKEVRSLSKYGLSQVTVIFEDETNIYWARQQVSERLQSVRENLPEGLSPELAPITTGLGEVLMYAVLPKSGTPLSQKSEVERLSYLRTVQDFIIRRYIKAEVSGVAEVDSNGGYKKEIHIDVDPIRLEQNGLSIEEIVHKVETIGESFGGGYIQHEGKQIIVRTTSSIDSLDPIRQIPVKLDVLGKPVQLKDIAEVREDFAQRMGAATYDGEEVVLGTVLMLSGANSRQVARDAENALAEMPVLPEDVEIKILYKRSFLVEATVNTVAKNLIEGAILVIIILLLILGNLRAAIIVTLAIPLSMLFASAGMKYFGISANLMSLGAIDFGLLVDGAVVIIENVTRRMAKEEREMTSTKRMSVILDAVQEVIAPVTIGLLLIMAVYVPIFALEGIEGKLFKPMAQVVLMALGGSLLVALLLMPILAYLFLRKSIKNKDQAEETKLFSIIRRLYTPILDLTLTNRKLVLVPVGIMALLALLVFFALGADFMPPLNEGDMVINLTRDASIAMDESIRLQKQSDKVIASFGEVEYVFSRIGTAESATDPMGVNVSDTFVILKKDIGKWPLSENGSRRDKDGLFQAMREEIDQKVPGQAIMQSQPIEMRTNELLEGSRADVTLRIYGKDLEKLMELVEQAEQILKEIPGASEVEMDPITAITKSPVLNVQLDYNNINRYGIDIQEVNNLVQMAMGGQQVGSFYEYQWRFPIVVRLNEIYRDNPKEIARLPVGLPEGGTVPLSSLAVIEQKEQVTTIAHEHGDRYAAVSINLMGRDTEGFVKEAKNTLSEKLELSQGYTLWWGGQFKNLEKASGRLKIIVPLTLIVIFFVLLRYFDSFRQTILVYVSIPLAMTGGVFSLYLCGINFSVSAAVGFIALSGIAILNAMVLVTFFNQERQEGAPLKEAVIKGALIRLRPVVMTALVASFGFLPMALNTGIGAEVQRPLATVVIGGIISSTILTLLIVPTLYLWIEQKFGEIYN